MDHNLDRPANQPLELGNGSKPADLTIMSGTPATPVVRVAAGAVALPSAPLTSGLLRGFKRRFGLAVGLGLVSATVVGLLAWLVMPMAKYSARAVLQVSATPPRVAFRTADLDALDNRLEFKNYQLTQKELIKSRHVLNSALRDPKVKGISMLKNKLDPVDWIAEELSFLYIGEVLFIQMSGNDPKDVVNLVNAVTDAYMREVVNRERNQRLERLGKLKDIYLKYQDTLKVKRNALRELAKSAGSNDKTTIAVKQQLALEQQHQADRDLREVRSDLRKAEMELAELPPPSERPVGETVDNFADIIEGDTIVTQARANVAKLTADLKNHQRRVRNPLDPALQKTRARIKAAEQELNGHRDRLRANLAQRQREQGRRGPDDERGQVERRIGYLKDLEKLQLKDVEKLKKDAQAFNESAIDLESIKDEIEHADNTAKQIGQEVESLTVELQAPVRVQLIEKAEVPLPGSAKKQLAVIAAAAFGSFACALFGVSWWESRWRRVDTADEVVQGLGMSLVGILPAQRPGGRRLALGSEDARKQYWDNLLLESIDATRAVVLRASRNESLQVFMVASALMGEGKSTLACHLATSLARGRFRTLLIDCDLRNPSLHKMFDVEPVPGICEVLRGEIDVLDTLRPIGNTNLSLITAGLNDAGSLEALVSGDLHHVLERVRGQFDFVIVDTAPVLPVADSLHVCQHVDAVIFSVLRDVSRIPKIYTAYERLSAFGARILGAVVAGARVEHDDSTYTYVGQSGSRVPAVIDRSSQ